MRFLLALHLRWIVATTVVLTMSGCDSTSPCPAPDEPNAAAIGERGRALNDLVRKSVDGRFSGSVLVERAGDVVLHAAYGYADPRACEPASPNHAYWLGSVSKQFAAAAMLRLQADGRLDVADKLSAHLADVPGDKQDITLRQLLTHTSGLTNAYAADGEGGLLQAVQRVLGQRLSSAPGTQFEYSNDGYSIVAAVVQTASGQPYEQYVHETLLEQADVGGIALTGDRASWGRLDMAARAHGADRAGSPQDWESDWGYKGGTGVLGTAAGLRDWFKRLWGGAIVPTAAAQELFAEQAATGRDGIAYGYGWFRFTGTDGRITILHNGDDDFIGHSASLRWYPDDELLVIVLSNSGYVDDRAVAATVAREVAAAVLEGGG